MKTSLFFVAVCMLLGGCQKTSEKPEETATKGKLVVFSTESHQEVLRQEAAEYSRLYPDVTFEVSGVSTREAIVHFLNDSVRCICVDRPFNQEELEVVKNAEILYAENVIALDAFAVLVNSKNAQESISFDDVRDIVGGAKRTWKVITGSRMTGAIELVLTGKNSGAYELLQRHFFHFANEIALTAQAGTQQEVVSYVSAHPQAIGIVSIATLRNNSLPVKVLAVESTNITVERFVKPTQINVYHSLYPLSYSLYLYTSASSTGVQAGFSTFVRAMHGQKIVQNAGLVPTVIPNRVIQITTE